MSAFKTSLPCLFALVLAPGALAVDGLQTSLRAKVSVDTNIFLQDEAPLSAGQTVAGLPAKASDTIATIGAQLAWVWHPNTQTQGELAYAPEIVRFSRYTSENHTDHRLSLTAVGSLTDNHYDIKASWLHTVGSHDSLIFNRLGGTPPVGGEPVRSRRAQDILKLTSRLTHPMKSGFVRGGLSVTEQNFHMRESAAFGYSNYVDRTEWVAGIDGGWPLTHDLFLITGVRHGRQQQADLLIFGDSFNYTNTLTRWLLGAEGKLGKAWRFNLLAGPDQRRFDPTVRPGFSRQRTTTYFEGTATWTPGKKDTFTASARRYLGLRSSGRGVLRDTVYELGWQHQMATAWRLNTTLSQHAGTVTPYNPAALRDDRIYTIGVNLSYQLGPKTQLELGVTQDWSRSLLPNTPARQYHRQVFSLGWIGRW